MSTLITLKQKKWLVPQSIFRGYNLTNLAREKHFKFTTNYDGFRLKNSREDFSKQKERLPNILKAFDDLKNKQKSAWSNIFWYLKICIFWKCIQYTIHWDKTHMLNGTKTALFFFFRELQPITVLLLIAILIWNEAQYSSL